ncbi:MAG: pitrilysin family protein [Patescibacteria group bacterium]
MYKLKLLRNGIKLITIPMRGTKTATILLMVRTGSKYENKKNNGISHFLEHMFFKGTKKRPNTLALAGELDSVGGEYNAFTGKEYTGYFVKVDCSKIKLAADIVSDMLLNSKFEQKEIDRERGVIVEEINMYHDNPLMYIEDIFENCLYGNTPAGWDTIGRADNILKFKRADFLKYFNSQYGAQNTIICLAGNIKNGTEKIISQYFNKLAKSKIKDKIAVKEKQIKPKIKIHYKKTDQASLSLGVRTFPHNDPDEVILKIIAIILGGSMSSRLFIKLRERYGLAYYVKTQAEFYTDSGYLTTQVGVPINKIEQAIKIILSEYSNMSKIKIKDSELLKNIELIKGRLSLQLEPSDSIASWYGRQLILKEKILTPEEFYKKISKIKAEDIRRVANRVFVNKGLNLAVIGPFRDKSRFERILYL